MKKRLLVIVMTLAMVLAMVPAFTVSVCAAENPVTLLVDYDTGNDSAVREEGAKYKTLEGALEDALSGDTIKLNTDISLSETVTVSKKIKLDLSGKELVVPYSKTIKLDSDADFTITGSGTINTKQQMFTMDGGKLTIVNGTYTKDSNASEGGLINCNNGGVVDIKGGSFSISVTEDKNSYAGFILYSGGENSKITVEAGEFTAETTTNFKPLFIGTDTVGKVYIKGGCWYGTNFTHSSAALKSVIIKGGSFDSKKVYDFSGTEIDLATKLPKGYIFEGDSSPYTVTPEKNFKIDSKYYPTLGDAVDDAKAGVEIIVNADSTIDELVKVDKELTLDLNGKTLTLTSKDSSRVIDIISGGKLTIEDTSADKKGKMKSEILPRLLSVNGGELVVNGGIFEARVDSYKSFVNVIFCEGGDVTLNGGTYSIPGGYGTSTDHSIYSSVIAATETGEKDSTITINDGTYNGAETEYFRAKLITSFKNGDAKFGSINVKGGTFNGVFEISDSDNLKCINITGGRFDHLNLVSNDYTEVSTLEDVIDSSKYYIHIKPGSPTYYAVSSRTPVCKIGDTKYEYIDDALQASHDSEGTSSPTEIVMIADDEENVTIPAGRNITIDLNNHILKGINKGDNKSSVITNDGTLTVTDSTMTGATKTGTTRYFTDSLCGEGIKLGEQCNECGGTAKKDGCFETLETSYNVEGKTEGIDYIKLTGGVITGGRGFGKKIGDTIYYHGGGIYSKGSLSVISGNIIGNNAHYGAGIFSEDSCKCEVKGSTIAGNNAHYFGGGIEAYIESELDIEGTSYICYNTASYGGGIYLESDNQHGSKMTCNEGSINGNVASNSGGGIFIAGISTCSIKNTTITNNKAYSGYGTGGGIQVGGAGTCFIEGTKITMADGTVKNIEDVKNGEEIRTFDHDTGKLSTEKVTYKFAGESKSSAMMLHFEDDIELGIVGTHGLLEKASRKYVALSAGNVEDYIGKYFYNADSAKWEKLLSVSYTSKSYNYYALYSVHHIDAIANHMLSVTDDALFRLNIFDLDENLKIDEAKKQKDIEKYGLTDYDDYKDIVDEENFYEFNNQYANVAVGKGLITWGELFALAEYATDDDSVVMQGEEAPLRVFSVPLTGTGAKTASLTIGNGVTISGNTVGTEENTTQNNVYLINKKYIKLDGADNTTPISLKMEVPGQFTTNGTKGDTNYFSSEDKTYSVVYNSSAYLELAEKTVCKVGDTKYATIAKALEETATANADSEAAGTPTTITLIDDDVENVTIPAGRNITLDLNDYVLKGDGTSSVITNNGTLTVTDSTMTGTTKTGTTRYFTDSNSDGCFETLEESYDASGKTEGVDYIKVTGGCITGGVGAVAGDGGGVTNNGKFNLVVGNIIGNTPPNLDGGQGGGVSNSGTFTMDGGCIVGNYSYHGGAGVFNYGSGKFTLNNGSIAYNTAKESGGGLGNNAEFTMKGGCISNNKSGDVGGGIYNDGEYDRFLLGGSIENNIAVNKAGGVLAGKKCTLGGTIKITGNKVNNVANNLTVEYVKSFIKGIGDVTTITTISIGEVAAAPQSGMNVGVTLLGLDGKQTSGQFTTNGSTTDTKYFFSDNDVYAVKFVKGDTTKETTDPLYNDHLELGTAYTVTEATCTNGSVSVGATKKYAEGVEVAITNTPDNGYELDEYSVYKTGEETTTVAVTDGKFTMPAYDVTVSATFKAKPAPISTSYTVTFDAQGHGTAPETQTITAGGKVKKPADPTAEGYVFGGWFKEAECVNAWDFDKDTVSKNTTLYAKWTEEAPAPAKEAFVASGTAKGTTNTIKWNAVEGADGYEVYFAKCGKSMKLLKSTAELKCVVKKLEPKHVYKYQVKAYKLVDGKKTYLDKTAAIHIAGAASKHSNATKVTVDKAELSLKAGDTAKLTAKIAKKSNAKALLWKGHVNAKIRYMSTDESVVTVDKNGNVKAVGKGNAYVYAYAANGVSAKVKISVTGNLGAVWIG